MKVSSKIAVAGIFCAIALVAACAKKEAPVEPMPTTEQAAPVAIDTSAPAAVSPEAAPAAAPEAAPAK